LTPQPVHALGDRDQVEALQRRTAAHYEAYPFDFMTPEDEAAVEQMQPPPFRRFMAAHASVGQAVAEIGCGPGRGTMYLVRKRLAVVAADISRSSLALARKRAPEAAFVQASNLHLPFADASFDLVISDGVIHHTPDAYRSFRENVRILKAGGHLYLGVYNRSGYYFYVYTFFGRPVRRLETSRFGRQLIHATLIPLYYAVHLIKSGGKRTWRGARNFFYDYLITPQASFHTREDIERWAAMCGLDILGYDPSLGNVHVFILRKSGRIP
jgi:ubiquinone/menaquinone biosynthesis C-methylase UbiE